MLNSQLKTDLTRILVLSLLYTSAAKFGQIFSRVGGTVTLVWLPAGIGLAALLIYGYRLWPGIFCGVVLANLSFSLPISTIVGMATGSSLGGVAGAYLLRKRHFHPELNRIKDALNLIVHGAGFSPIISSLIDVPSLWLAGVTPKGELASFWLQFIMGDAMGVLVMTPVCITWASLRNRKLSLQRQTEGIILFSSLTLVCGIVFNGWFLSAGTVLPAFLVYPFLVWAPLRFGTRGASTAIFIISGLALFGLAHQVGPFVTHSTFESLILLWLFVNVAAIVSLVLAASISELTTAKHYLEQLALHDSLTGLDNRLLLMEKLAESLAQVHRYDAQSVILYLDLDGFKPINDSFGHEVGDGVLIEVAKRLKSCVREVDTVARLGGDEFVVLLHNLSDIYTIETVADRIVETINIPMHLFGKTINVGVSMGIAMIPQDGEYPHQLLKNADIAMYRAKQQGKNQYQFYSRE
ncbi:MAG: diguanylate cyclase [Lyngbya sp.]|nr:diguanylate cyclase [Lyngbya sp.]